MTLQPDMNAEAILPDPDQLWSLEDQLLAVQQLAFKFFEAENWIWAAKMLFRVERLSRRLNPDPPRARRAKRRAETPEAEVPLTDEEEYADVVAAVEETNGRRARAKVPPMTMEEALAFVAEERGQDFADRLAAIHARQTPGPSG